MSAVVLIGVLLLIPVTERRKSESELIAFRAEIPLPIYLIITPFVKVIFVL